MLYQSFSTIDYILSIDASSQSKTRIENSTQMPKCIYISYSHIILNKFRFTKEPVWIAKKKGMSSYECRHLLQNLKRSTGIKNDLQTFQEDRSYQ